MSHELRSSRHEDRAVFLDLLSNERAGSVEWSEIDVKGLTCDHSEFRLPRLKQFRGGGLTDWSFEISWTRAP